jgi:hypothetical protein
VLSALSLAAMGTNASAGYSGGDVTDGGSVSGKVTFKGKVPKAMKMKVTKNADVCGTSKTSEELLVGGGGALKNAVVYLKGIKKGKAVNKGVVQLGQVKCVYTPHVQAAVKGSKLHLESSDPIMHNVHGKMKKGGRMLFNVGMPGNNTVVKKKLRRAGLAEIICDAGHTWMKAYIYVFEHPYFAVTGADGKFDLGDVPPGNYELVVWHEKLGEKKAKVTVTAGAAATSDFAFKK